MSLPFAEPPRRLVVPAALAAVLTFAACGSREDLRSRAEPSRSPNARPELVAALRQDLATERGPRDGGGRAWLEGREPVVAGGRGSFSLVYEVGPEGIALGGMVFLQVSPFWGWSTPQVEDPLAPGYTEVTTDAEGVELEPATVDQQLLGIRVAGRELAGGERLRILYGAGPAGARVDRFAERRSVFWFAVDGDGDGVRGLLVDPPTVQVLAGPPARLVLLLPTTARPGETVRLVASLLDRWGNAGVEVEGPLRLELPVGLSGPATVDYDDEEHGIRAVPIEVEQEGVYRVEATAPGGVKAVSNPLVVRSTGPRILWADLHGHSGLSDGTGTPEDYFRYARDVAALDVVALTDHDHWGMRPLSQTPAMWQEIRRQVEAFHAPGRFVTLLGYEWTSWLHGHRHVLYFGDDGQVLSSVDPAYESPLQLWSALRGQPVLTFAHHSAGGPIATNWVIPPDPELEPVTEIVSVHGSSEALDSPGTIYSPVPGNFVRDALGRGYELGFIGSGDSHDGHPGLAQLASPSSGLAAIVSEELTRNGVYEALRARRVYATNGARIYLDVRLDGAPMGGEVLSGGSRELTVRAVAPQPIARAELIGGGDVRLLAEDAGTELTLRETLQKRERRAEFLYVRIVLEGGGAAWSSPFFAPRP